MPRGPNRCIFGDIATVPGYEAWLAKCIALGAAEHKSKKWFHANETNPTAAANPSHAKLVPTMPIHELSALLIIHNVLEAP